MKLLKPLLLLFAFLRICPFGLCAGLGIQVEPAEPNYCRGEPINLTLKITNNNDQAVFFAMNCWNDDATKFSGVLNGDSLGRRKDIAYISGAYPSLVIEPGETYETSIFPNAFLEIEGEGLCQISVAFRIPVFALRSSELIGQVDASHEVAFVVSACDDAVVSGRVAEWSEEIATPDTHGAGDEARRALVSTFSGGAVQLLLSTIEEQGKGASLARLQMIYALGAFGTPESMSAFSRMLASDDEDVLDDVLYVIGAFNITAMKSELEARALEINAGEINDKLMQLIEKL